MGGRPITGWSVSASDLGFVTALLGRDVHVDSTASIEDGVRLASARWGRSRVAAVTAEFAWSSPPDPLVALVDGPIYTRLCPEHDGDVLACALSVIECGATDAVLVRSRRANVEASMLIERAASSDWVLCVGSTFPPEVRVDAARLPSKLEGSFVAAVATVLGGLEAGIRWPEGVIEPGCVRVSLGDMNADVEVRE